MSDFDSGNSVNCILLDVNLYETRLSPIPVILKLNIVERPVERAAKTELHLTLLEDCSVFDVCNFMLRSTRSNCKHYHPRFMVLFKLVIDASTDQGQCQFNIHVITFSTRLSLSLR